MIHNLHSYFEGVREPRQRDVEKENDGGEDAIWSWREEAQI